MTNKSEAVKWTLNVATVKQHINIGQNVNKIIWVGKE